MTITHIKTCRFFGLNLTAVETLLTLSDEGAMDMTSLADRLQVTTVSITNIADRLSKIGLVERVRSATDRRSITLRLTDKGMGRVFQITGRHAAEPAAY
jgi:DNA-binding MarR family transcriptional regulator